MDNLETLATLGTQDTGQINLRENLKGQSRMDNLKTLTTLGMQSIGRRQTKPPLHRKLKR